MDEICLPQWVISAIDYIAYERGHSAGEEEVEGIRKGMEEVFLDALKDALKSANKV